MTNDRPPVPQPPADVPLGIQRPLLPSVPLGQSLLQPKFLTPLGARSLSVLDPAIFLSGQDADLPTWESPFQDSPFFDPTPARSPEAPTLAVQTKPQSQLATPNPPTINSPLNSSIESVAPLESVADFSPVDFPSIDPVAAPEFSEPTLPPSDLISEPEAIAPEATVQRSPENLSDSDFLEATVQRSPENSLGSDFPETSVQRSPENSSGSEAIVPPINPQFDLSGLVPEAPQPTLTDFPAAEIDLPATVQRSPENPSPENSPVPASETAAIAPTLAAEIPVSEAALAETLTSPSPVEPERSTVPESLAPPVLPPPPATIQRVETPEAAAEIEPILAKESINPTAPASELEQGSGEEILHDSATPEAVEPPSLSIEPASIEPLPSSSPSDETESNFSTESEIEPAPSETVQRSIVEPAPIDFEAENSVDAIAPSVNNDRTDSPETVQRKIEASTRAETRAEEFNQALVEPNRAIDAPESMAETVAQASSLPGQNAAPTSDETPKAQESHSTENNSAQDQPIDPSGDSLETPAESLPQVASIEPVQNPIILPQIQALAEMTPSLPQPQPEIPNSFHPVFPSKIISEASVNQVAETENISPQPIQLKAKDQQDQSDLPMEVNRVENPSQDANEADSSEQPKEQEQSIAPNSIIPIEKTEAISQLLVPLQIKTEDFTTKQTDFLAASEIGSTDSPERDRTEETQLSPTQPIAENLSSPIQRKAAEANSSKPSSIDLPKAETKVAIDQILSESTDNLELETQSSNNVSPEPTFAVEPSVKRSTSEIRQTEEISTPLPRRESESFPETEPATLPELPTVIQRLSVLEPIAQMKPLYSSTDFSTVQPLQAARSTTIPDMQTQQFDRLFDLPPPSNVMRKSDVAPLDSVSTTSPVTAEWSNIAELFQTSEEFRSEPSAELSTDSSFEFNSELETTNELNGYSDLNLSSNNVGPSDVGSDVAQAKRQPPTEVSNSDAIETHPKSHSAQVSASPEQLERLAQEIYQLVRQRLALERERFGNASSGRLF